MLNVLSRKLEFQTNIDAFESFILTRRYHEPGEFELHVNRYSFGTEHLLKNNIIALNQRRAGIIKHRELPLDESGKTSENWVIKGPTMQGIMDQRITIPPAGISHDNKSGNAETVMKHYVDRNAINPLDRKRKFVMLRAKENQNRGRHVNWQSRYKVLSEELRDISLASGLGWDVSLDTKRGWWVFDVIEGRDLTKMDGPYQPVTFSVDNDTIINQTITDSDLNMRNVGYVGGQGEGELREILILGQAEDLDRAETFIDARDVGEDEEEGGTVGSNGESLEERGQRKMEELENEFFFEAQVLTPLSREVYGYIQDSFLAPFHPVGKMGFQRHQLSPYIYGEDFDLGDNVRLVDQKLGIQRIARITEVKEIYERSTGLRIEVTFGQSRPTFPPKLKSKISQFDNELLK